VRARSIYTVDREFIALWYAANREKYGGTIEQAKSNAKGSKEQIML